MQHTRVRAGSARSQQATPRNAGTNPRAVKAAAKKPPTPRSRPGVPAKGARKPTEDKDLLATLKESVRQAKAKKKP
jgi:hypothetical protein